MFNAGRGAGVHPRRRQRIGCRRSWTAARSTAGAVCGVTHIRNPIELARTVMEHSDYVLLSGAGAEEFALSRGFALVPRSYFYTPERWRQLERIRGGDAGFSALTISHVGTVGAVALDGAGRLAAATSTGGMTGKRYNRIGDSPHHRRGHLRGRPLLRRIGDRARGSVHSRRGGARHLCADALRRRSLSHGGARSRARGTARPCRARAESSPSTGTARSSWNSIRKGCFAPAGRAGEDAHIAIYGAERRTRN